MSKRKKTSLPRVTLMAYNRRDLLAFCEAVEALRHLVVDLRAEVTALRDQLAATARSKSRSKKSSKDSVCENEARPSLSAADLPDLPLPTLPEVKPWE